MPGIVMGHDGSKHAQEALAEAADLAAALGEPLTVVAAFHLRQGDWPEDLPFGTVPTTDELEAHARGRLEERVAPVRESHPGLAIEVRVVEGKPVRVLAEASRDARMLVVGTRGVGGFDRLLVGSVAEQLVQHADCPVLVTRAR